MYGCLRNCLGNVVLLLLLVGGGAAAWTWGPDVVERFRNAGAAEPSANVASPELSDATLDRFEAFQRGGAGSELRLGDAQLSSLVRYALPGALPPGVDEPSVTVKDGRIGVSARVALSIFPDLPALREIVSLLPDTVTIEVGGTLVPFTEGRSALYVDRMDAARVPIPPRLFPEILTALGRTDVKDLPRDAMLVPLPQGLRSAYVLRDSLVLVSNP